MLTTRLLQSLSGSRFGRRLLLLFVVCSLLPMTALAVLSDLVAGNGDFDISDSTEYVEGAVVGFDPRVLKRLRRGEFAYQAMIDLHGMSAAAARVEVERFILHSVAEGHRGAGAAQVRGRLAVAPGRVVVADVALRLHAQPSGRERPAVVGQPQPVRHELQDVAVGDLEGAPISARGAI